MRSSSLPTLFIPIDVAYARIAPDPLHQRLQTRFFIRRHADAALQILATLAMLIPISAAISRHFITCAAT